MHLPPEVWGPIFWSTFHIVALAYPDEPNYSEKRAAKEFFKSMMFLLPCPVCRAHFTEIMRGMPVDTWLDDRASLIEWVVQVHNHVNSRLGKREFTVGEFMERYQQFAARGLPIPPATSMSELSDSELQAAYVQGIYHGLAGIACASAVGWLLWASYK